MNARLYDPVLGRFLGMDPYVQMPDFTQNYNRYSYCLNRPLTYTDPSGEVIGVGEVLAVALYTYMGGVMANLRSDNAFNPGQWNWKSPSTYLGIAGGAMKGLNMVGISTPSPTSKIGDILGHGSSGSVGIELARAGMHGLINGGMNAAQGGDF